MILLQTLDLQKLLRIVDSNLPPLLLPLSLDEGCIRGNTRLVAISSRLPAIPILFFIEIPLNLIVIKNIAPYKRTFLLVPLNRKDIKVIVCHPNKVHIVQLLLHHLIRNILKEETVEPLHIFSNT